MARLVARITKLEVAAAVTPGQGLCALLAFAPMPFAQAQTAADFYKGKNLDLYIGYSVGGAYDLYARTIARHLGKHIPGSPTIVPKNMEGAGSLRLANWLYKAAPRDGSAFGTIGRGIAQLAPAQRKAARRRRTVEGRKPNS